MGISSPRVGPDGRGLAKHLQPAMMILWTNEPLIKGGDEGTDRDKPWTSALFELLRREAWAAARDMVSVGGYEILAGSDSINSG
jgi:hypothetical protein